MVLRATPPAVCRLLRGFRAPARLAVSSRCCLCSLASRAGLVICPFLAPAELCSHSERSPFFTPQPVRTLLYFQTGCHLVRKAFPKLPSSSCGLREPPLNPLEHLDLSWAHSILP